MGCFSFGTGYFPSFLWETGVMLNPTPENPEDTRDKTFYVQVTPVSDN